MIEDEGLYHNGLVIMTMIEYILKEKFLQIDLSWHLKGQLIVNRLNIFQNKMEQMIKKFSSVCNKMRTKS